MTDRGFTGKVVNWLKGCLLAWLLLTAWSTGAQAEKLRIGVLTLEPPHETMARWGATADLLNARLPLHSFEIVPLSYDDLNSAVRQHEIDFVFTNPEHYVVLRNVYGISPLATVNTVVGGKVVAQFGSTIFTTSSHPQVRQLSDVKGQRIAAVGLYSLGGFLAAADVFRREHIDLRSSDVKSLTFLGAPHVRVVDAVLSGKADVGIVRTGVLEQLASQGKIDLAQVKVLNLQPDSSYPQALSTPLFPEWPMAAMPNVPPELSKSVSLALLQITSGSDAALKGKYSGFFPPANYSGVEDLMRRLKVYPNVEALPLWKEIWLEYTHTVQIAGLLLLITGIGSTLYFWRGNRQLRRLTTLYSETQKELAEERTQLQYIIEGTNAGTWQLNIRTGEVTINARWYEMAGYAHSDKAPWGVRTWLDLCHPGDKRRVIRALRAHCAGKSPAFQCEYRMRHRNGHWMWVQDSGRLLAATGEVAAEWVFGTHTDVTDRVQAQQSHEEQLAFIEVLLETLPTAVYIKDTLGRYQRFNKAFESLFGIDRNAWIGKTVFDLVPGESGHYMHRKDQELFKTSEPQIYEATFTNQALGQQREGLYYKALITGRDGMVLGMVGTVVDVTERNQAARALEESNRQAHAATQAKGFFLANMSHELRTPMHAILGMLKLLQTTEQTERQYDYSSKAEFAAKGLLVLLDDILDFSKMDAGKMELDPQPFFLDGLLRNIATVLSASRRKNDVEVMFDLDPALPKSVMADSMRLQQILINLGSNAIKFTERGRVTIGISVVPSPVSNASTVSLLFSVSDTGIGIARENFDRIFAGFSQAEASTTRRFGGTGLGLAISKRLIELMGGEICLNSEPGLGSIFSFELTLPLVTMRERRTAARTESLEAQKVLIIDDNKLSVALLGKLTQSLGWTADAAYSGPQALDLLQGNIRQGVPAHDVIFLDWQMPDMDGWEALERIRKLFESHQLPTPKVIMVSSNGRESLELRTQQEQETLAGFLVKPVTPSMMLEVVQRRHTSDSHLRSRTRASKRQLAGMKILVVEDNLLNQQVAEELLASEGANVYLAENGRVAVNALSEPSSHYDAVLMDIQMPVLDGYGATREIRQGLRMQDIPIIGLTSNAMPVDRENCLAAGMNVHMGKPFDLRALVSLLIRLTGHIPASPIEPQTPEPVAIEPVKAKKLVNEYIDVETALARMGGMVSVYVRSAKTLHESLGSLIDQFHQALAAGDMAQTKTLAHTSKGTCATLGLTLLSAELARLDSALKNNQPSSELLLLVEGLRPALTHARTSLLQAIANMDADQAPHAQAMPEGERPEINTSAAVEGLQRLLGLLKNADMSALEHFAQLSDGLQAMPPAELAPLKDAMNDLAFDRAQSECERLIGKLSQAA